MLPRPDFARVFRRLAMVVIRAESIADAIEVELLCNCRILNFLINTYLLGKFRLNYLSLNKFDCRPIRDASIAMPAWIHLANRQARHVIFPIGTIGQLLLSAQWYFSGAFSLIDRRKKPFSILNINRIAFYRRSSLTLHASQVTAPKWIPDADAPQIKHGSFLYKSPVRDSFGSIC